MDNQTPKHVQVEDKKPAAVAPKQFVIFYNDKEGKAAYVNTAGIDAAFLKKVELQLQDMRNIVVFQEVDLKVSLR